MISHKAVSGQSQHRRPSDQGASKYYGLFHGVRVEGGPQNCLPERMILLCKYLCLLRLLDDLHWCAD